MSTTKRKKVPAQTTGNSNSAADVRMDNSVVREIKLLAFLGLCILLFLGNFGWAGIGDTGINWLSNRLKGLIGILEYILPVFMFICALYLYVNPNNRRVKIKIILTLFLGFIMIMFIQFLYGSGHMGRKWGEYFSDGVNNIFCGGAVGGKAASLLYSLLGLLGGILVLVFLAIIITVMLTEKSFLGNIVSGGRKGSAVITDNINRSRQKKNIKRSRAEAAKAVKINYSNKGSSREKRKSANGMSLITLDKNKKTKKKNFNYDEEMHELFSDNIKHKEQNYKEDILNNDENAKQQLFTIQKDGKTHLVGENTSVETASDNMNEVIPKIKSAKKINNKVSNSKKTDTITDDKSSDNKVVLVDGRKQYEKPSFDLLKKNDNNYVESDVYLREMGLTLQRTLQSFGVNVTVLNVSCGPSVTRYELQPEKGVKVSKITNLADDIKLNLAVSDIRIEAPIPGKAAVGIEVPNRTASAVLLRELLESKHFKDAKSPLTFAVGKDISGNIVIGDIAKMPHLLVAGSTGSGKSVCINTIIMSLLYKADPEELKLILIDPKVVELSVYNGIPQMFIPVVTDPKKAAGALNWAVAEMDDRYNKMSELGVRDLEGYNKKIAALPDNGEESPKPFSRLVIIVDELADLMMVCGNEVEAAICRLAQKARAAGIHLILATQRPSVDVITGLIKANMPSRIAFAVSSGVDSRTIIDINGAEKLLGKGDMLFYPSGFPKPVRVQGAFVSDKEVSDVVEFLANQNIEEVSAKEIEERMNIVASSSAVNGVGNNQYDEYFVQAGNFVIEKGKASTSMIQRVFKVGFNRAARIVSQLEDAGVVGPEEGTKPRKVIMSEEEFNQFVEESV